jgi:hypothetical protein
LTQTTITQQQKGETYVAISTTYHRWIWVDMG